MVELGETDGGADAAVAVTRGYNTRSRDDGGAKGPSRGRRRRKESAAGRSAARLRRSLSKGGANGQVKNQRLGADACTGRANPVAGHNCPLLHREELAMDAS